MSKIIYFGILLIAGMIVSCSVNDVLAPSEDVDIAVMETVDVPKVAPGDTISFKFVASTSKGKLTRIEIKEQVGDFTPIPDSLKFALVDQNLQLAIDKEGYLSRPVSTVMMIYPVVMGNRSENIGKTASIIYRVSNDRGKSSDVNIRFEVINHRIYTTSVTFYKYYGKMSGSFFYDPYKHKTYSYKNFEHYKEQVELVAYQDENKVNYCMDPASKETEELLTAEGGEYKAAEMRETLMYKVKNADFTNFTDADFLKLDFTQAVHKLTMENGDMIAFKTSDGRKGVMSVTISSGGYPMIKSKIQAIAQ